MCLFVYLSICRFVYLSMCRFADILIFLFVYLSACLFVYFSICLFVFLSIWLFIYLPICRFVYLSICRFVDLSICQFVLLKYALTHNNTYNDIYIKSRAHIQLYTQWTHAHVQARINSTIKNSTTHFADMHVCRVDRIRRLPRRIVC